MSVRLMIAFSICIAAGVAIAAGDEPSTRSQNDLPQSHPTTVANATSPQTGPTTAPTQEHPEPGQGAQNEPVNDLKMNRPHSSEAVAAMREYQQACNVAEDVCIKSKTNADRKLITKLKRALVVATQEVNLVEANAIEAQITAATARMSAETPSASANQPVKIFAGPAGGEHGQPFTTGMKTGSLVQIRIYSGKAIEALQFVYLVDGQRVESQRFGGSGGNLATLDLQPGECITGIFGSGGDHLRSLRFVTNQRKTDLFGEESTGKFGFGIDSEAGHPSGYEIANFYGFTGTGINSIGVEIRPNP